MLGMRQMCHAPRMRSNFSIQYRISDIEKVTAQPEGVAYRPISNLNGAYLKITITTLSINVE